MRTGDFSELLVILAWHGVRASRPSIRIAIPATSPSRHNPYAGFHQSRGLIFDPTTCSDRARPATAASAGNVIPNGPSESGRGELPECFPDAHARSDRYQNNYLDTQSETNKYNTFDGRMDWVACSKDMAFFRFSYDNSVNSKTSEFANLPAGGGTGTNPTHARG